MLNRHKIVSLNDTLYFLKDFFEKCKQQPQAAVGNYEMKVNLIFAGVYHSTIYIFIPVYSYLLLTKQEQKCIKWNNRCHGLSRRLKAYGIDEK